MSAAAADGAGGNYTKQELEESAANKEAYFAGLQGKNEARSADLPPSQGGKYAGFGSGSIDGGAGAPGDSPKKKSRFGSMMRSRGKGGPGRVRMCVRVQHRPCHRPYFSARLCVSLILRRVLRPRRYEATKTATPALRRA